MDSGDDLERAVIAYLDEHPRAEDTLEGIAQFWLSRQRIRCTVEAVAAALDGLVAKGEIAIREHSDPRAYHRPR